VAGAGARVEFEGEMSDRRFDRKRALSQRDEVLRLRMFRPSDGSAPYGVLAWKGKHSKRGEYRHRAEVEARVADPDAVVTILQQLGFKVSLQIDRQVEIYRLGGAVLRFAWYPVMDVLLCVEGDPGGIVRAICGTGVVGAVFLA